MILQYGGWASDAYECQVAINRTTNKDKSGSFIKSITERWTITGTLVESSRSQLIQKLRRREAAFLKQGGNLRWKFTDGLVAHELLSGNTYHGTQVVGPVGYPTFEAGELAVQRKWTATVEAEIIIAADLDLLIEGSQEISYSGGGPRYVVLECLNREPQRQLTSPQTPQVIRQSGSLTRRGSFPTPPGPLFPALADPSQRQLTRRETFGSPEKEVTYSYTMVATTPII